MKLYYMETLNPRKACAVARYLNSPVEFIRVDLGKGEQTTARVPRDQSQRQGSDAGGRRDETLGGGRDHVPPRPRGGIGSVARRRRRQIEVIRWLSWNANHFTRHAGSLYFEHLIKPHFGMGGPDAAAVEEATGFVKRFGGVLNDHLRGRKYLVGDTLSVADFAVGITLPYADQAKIPLDEFPEIERWHARLNELPAWREPFPGRNAEAA